MFNEIHRQSRTKRLHSTEIIIIDKELGSFNPKMQHYENNEK